ncbi:4'-phosphopantetheinyl transferase superfamily protein [Streptomyces sp. F63]|uniref:4'-phosphopantetheinyl transferase family protein n=1 Tax=Streptomyces sp. F63 TaxID=2824887 RepID=UPI001B35842F|nr:4'-phosphopantetheinyl transferase superfamily protein [Streptomyces sp. F63]MBQ0983231.1 4'-phosphopantetheinyl transferase superfamily protein [Streptomyces sp. F63]
MIERILPRSVACADTTRDEEPEAFLFPEEEAAIARAVAKRRREYAAGRHCARLALREIGHPDAPLLSAERGGPRWPVGVAGSITHCDGYRAAAVAPLDAVASLGIDAEPNQPVEAHIREFVLLPAEQAALRALTRRSPEIHWDRLMFSAKESVYKTWHPLARRWLGFHDAQIDFTEDGGFRVRLLVEGPLHRGRSLTGFDGRWMHADGLLITSVVLPASRRGR